MVREFHQDRDHSLLLIIDLALPDTPRVVDLERVEAAVSAAATFCVDFCRRGGGTRLVLGTAGETTEVWEGPGTEAALVPVMERLAVVSAGRSAGMGDLLQRGLAVAPPDARRILITTRSAAEIGQSSAALSQLPGGTFEVIEASPEKLSDYVQFFADELG